MFVMSLAILLDYATLSAQLAALDTAAPEDARRKAVKLVLRQPSHPASLAALPRLEALVRAEPDAGVRSNAVLAAGQVAARHKRPCPAVLFDALTDPDRDGVRTAAVIALDGLKPLPPGSTAKLLRVATTGDADQRDLGYLLLATHAPKDPAALKVLRDAAGVPDVMKRHNARCALFRATDTIADLFPHILDLYVLRGDTPYPGDDAPEDAKRENAALNLTLIGAATIMARWTQDRPDEFRDELTARLQLSSPKVRVEVLRRLQMFAEALAEPEPMKLIDDLDPKRMRAGMKAILTDPATRLALKTAADKDPSAAVRELAKDVFGKLP